jgi:hypothetical protein
LHFVSISLSGFSIRKLNEQISLLIEMATTTPVTGLTGAGEVAKYCMFWVHLLQMPTLKSFFLA